MVSTLKDTRQTLKGGGPTHVRIVRVGDPEGLIVPTAEIEIEVTKRDGTVTRLRPQIPLPFLWSWAYRFARHLRVPLVSALDPGRIGFEVKVPGR